MQFVTEQANDLTCLYRWQEQRGSFITNRLDDFTAFEHGDFGPIQETDQ